jgi:hypothetical protein
VAGCYAQPEGWRFSIAKDTPNAARTMARHVQVHETHRVNADTLVARVGRLAVTSEGYQCLGCDAILSGSKRLSRAVNHVCRQPSAPQYRRANLLSGALSSQIHQEKQQQAVAEKKGKQQFAYSINQRRLRMFGKKKG